MNTNQATITETEVQPVSLDRWSDRAVNRLVEDLNKVSEVEFMGHVWGCPKVLDIR